MLTHFPSMNSHALSIKNMAPAQHRTITLPAYKRDTYLAGQYHSCDFEWAVLAAEVQPIVAQQELLGRAALAAASVTLIAPTTGRTSSAADQALGSVDTPPTLASITTVQGHADRASLAACAPQPQPNILRPGTAAAQAQQGGQHCQAPVTEPEGSCQASSTTTSSPSLNLAQEATGEGVRSSRRRWIKQQRAHVAQQQGGVAQDGWQQQPGHTQWSMKAVTLETQHLTGGDHYDGGKWDEFYSSTARSVQFFRERRYLLKEFPVLADGAHTRHVVELGCGSGASLMPIMRSFPVQVTATDISPTSLSQLCTLAETLEEAMPGAVGRLTTFVADSASQEALVQFQGLQADVTLIMFTLSAVPPLGQAHMLANAYVSLRPGGFLCIRDHGLYDMVQLRIPPEQWVGQNMYKRGDGTLAYFFSIEDMAAKGRAAGFEVAECEYVTVYNTNRKTGLQLRRVFIHAILKKPVF